ncbi:glycosylphosphatidylinositol anchor attachment 1 protein-like [Dreissena polymorpha]|uniref:glycosylphosphatidylinositol anchor attachment 1 protein-like n=1 Tax=Dreissena polymorpha TaxID=45954 RepID=UPI00226422EA|nr:glycosylphosphatidylinositol anchor attachment 1 protein-like [Dreissena polymorpha]XP_052231015.1 glycosylphosphatidylinositol anchor attachment 1 protein-like [Dreissena polymorpha]XP_052231016.1 glycosylphosphatidylinositol anchor attachment 1 protein-like [Dreissena polymorpha]XP_052231017.1 glycosylphosphatidylinositol anchor attachment 1 protein-like [Dreissena polymorpha]
MGILSNPKSRQLIVEKVSRYNNILCGACYVVGVIWFMALAYKPFNAKTYFSENALLPGVVESGFFFDFDVSSYITEVKEELKRDKRNVPRDWLYQKMREAGLETYKQNYTIHYPLHILQGQLVPGQNVYGILRARRASRVEAVVLSVPLRSKSSELPQTYGGLIVMLGLVRYFIRQPYWSKDIIFLATDREELGMQAWLDGYHHVHSQYIRPDELPARSGQIQAALNLEIPDSNIQFMNIKMEGLNGQLPNLDLVNLVVRLCNRHGLQVKLHNKADVSDMEAETPQGYLQSAGTMVRMMWAQASGSPSGNHGLFHRYHIEAVTLEAVCKKKTGRFSLDTVGRVVEGIFRSLNNLLERFHQSFFFYLLPGTERYVSIGLYMIPFAIICCSCLIKAIALWVKLSADASKPDTDTDIAVGEGKAGSDKNVTETTAATQEKTGKKLDTKSLHDIVEEDTDIDDHDDRPSGVLSILPLVLSSVIMSVLCYTGPELLSSVAVPFKMNVEDGIFYGFIALFTASLMFPKMIARRTSEEKRLNFDWRLLKALTLIFQSLMLFGLALMNISLAYFLAVLFVPVSVLVHPSKSRVSQWGQKLLLLLISPFSILYVATVIRSLGDKNEGGSLGLLGDAWSNLSHGVLLTLVDRYFFGNWLFALFSFAVFPNWLSLWSISFCESE